MGLFTMLFISACGDDPLPEPVAAFSVDSDSGFPEVGIPIMFDNLSTNANSYTWDFGDGSTSEETSPTHTYDSPDEYTVTVTAINLDGTSISDSMNIEVGERILQVIIINGIEFSRQDGTDWDAPDSTGIASNPDVSFIISPVANPAAGLSTFPIANLTIDQLTDGSGNSILGFDASALEVQLTDEDWSIVFVDIDDFTAFTGETMVGVTFNPVLLFTSIVNEDDGAGLMNVSVGGFNVDITFQIQLL